MHCTHILPFLPRTQVDTQVAHSCFRTMSVLCFGKFSMFRIILTTYTILTLAGVSILGVGMGMRHGEEPPDRQMMGCIFMNEPAAACPMTIAEHIGKWRETFLAVLTSDVLFLIIFLAVAPVVKKIAVLLSSLPMAYQLYRRDHPNLRIFTPLFLAFARGILHPRLYA